MKTVHRSWWRPPADDAAAHFNAAVVDGNLRAVLVLAVAYAEIATSGRDRESERAMFARTTLIVITLAAPSQ